jgi:hypothetical protein
MGDEDSAKKDLQSALQKGNESVELLYNYSRISADSLDTAGSREYLLQARSLAPDIVSALQAREEKLGAHHPAGYANVRIPFSNLLSTLWDDQYAPKAYLSSALLFGQSPFFAIWCGLAFLLLSVISVGAKGKRRLSPYFAGYQPSRMVLYLMRILPGGHWAMRQNPTVAAILFSVGAFFSLPLLGWPSDARWLMVLFPGWAPAYFTVVGSVTLVVVVIGFISSEE